MSRRMIPAVLFGALPLLLATAPAGAVTVFEASFEGGTVAADIGALSFSGGDGNQSIVTVEAPVSSTTDWETGALFADRGSANNAGNPTWVMDWGLTSPVALDGASVDFEFVLRRFNNDPNRDHFVTGYDSNGAELFSVMLIDRHDSGLSNIGDYVGAGESDERQRQTIGYVDPVNGDSLFASSQIATGAIPDSNSGSNTFTGFYGADNNDDTAVDETDAALVNISLSSTGWTLSGIAAPAPFPGSNPPLSDFTTIEIPYTDAGVVNLARVEVTGRTEQSGGFWDNLSVEGDLVPGPTPLTLQVLSNGEMRLLGGDPGGASFIEIDAIQITSEDVEDDGGSLNPAGFTGLAGAGFPAGDGSGNGWELGLSISDEFISESFLLGSSQIDNTDDLSLGNGYVPGGTQDISFSYTVVGASAPTIGLVEYVTVVGQSGDFNNDGVVDAADYALWRNNLGQPEGALSGNGDGSGTVDTGDYDLWRANFGAGSGTGAGAAIPEPASLALMLLALAPVVRGRRR